MSLQTQPNNTVQSGESEAVTEKEKLQLNENGKTEPGFENLFDGEAIRGLREFCYAVF